MDEQELIGPGAAGQLLGVSRERVRQLIDQGRLRATRGPYGIRMIRRSEVLELVKVRDRERDHRRR